VDASPRNDSSASMTANGPPGVAGRDRVVVGVSGRFDAHGVFDVGECSETCRSMPAVAMNGNTGWMSVVLTIDRWP